MTNNQITEDFVKWCVEFVGPESGFGYEGSYIKYPNEHRQWASVGKILSDLTDPTGSLCL